MGYIVTFLMGMAVGAILITGEILSYKWGPNSRYQEYLRWVEQHPKENS